MCTLAGPRPHSSTTRRTRLRNGFVSGIRTRTGSCIREARRGGGGVDMSRSRSRSAGHKPAASFGDGFAHGYQNALSSCVIARPSGYKSYLTGIPCPHGPGNVNRTPIWRLLRANARECVQRRLPTSTISSARLAKLSTARLLVLQQAPVRPFQTYLQNEGDGSLASPIRCNKTGRVLWQHEFPRPGPPQNPPG